ncbi:amino acid ABC transporter permease [Leucobacter rhizosphaerae]|uniref:Amino acid ABC transporter permease n=1 Tax=Leucobacter rhizosphaerae TaxID=2932245 RepID=A0ABY4FZS9_9MICO|nr:amino acid ABC transporter permease [Leucobacter rhizosphaerae]UOQ61803.1 amino acid ABC transporter permease [Leucobacter rhizosphaerae]
MNDFSWLYDWPRFIPELLPGLWVALGLTVVSCGMGYVLGFFFALMADSKSRVLRIVSLVLVELGRGIPILVLLLIVYQGLPQFGVMLSAAPSAIAALTFSSAGYSSEMIRAGLGAVPKGQFEAASSVSMSAGDTYRFIIIPQAARISIPPLVNLTITIFQATSLATVITVPEIMQRAGIIGSATFEYMSVYTAAAVLYLCITIPGAYLSSTFERRLGGGTRPARARRGPLSLRRFEPPQPASVSP